MGSVYLVGSKNLGWYKIGYSTKDDPSVRIEAVSKVIPFPLKLIHSWVTTFHPEKLEAFLHQSLKNKLLKGEWFKLEDSDIEFCQEQAASFLEDFDKQSLPAKRLGRKTNEGRHWTCSPEARQARSERMKGKRPPNLTMKGRTQSKDMKEKASQSHKEFYANNPEAVAALNAARPRGENHVFFGKDRPQETCDKIAASLTGKKQSPETRRLRSKSLKEFYRLKKEI